MKTAVDLFAGLGGNSEGARQAGINVLWAGNHWPQAVQVHANNHPDTAHICQDLHQADWTTVPDHDLLMASPACQGHTKARGKERPHHDAARSTAWAVVSACECKQPPTFLVENVPEFLDWTLYPTWADALRRLGYSLAVYVRDAADHGVPQHRQRVFIVGTRSKHPISLKLPNRPHQPISTVLDFDDGNWSAVARRGRSPKTLARIANGRARYGRRFLMPYYGSGSGLTGRSLDRPLGTVTTRARWALVDGDRMRMLTAAENRAAMGFPDGYALPKSTTLAIHMLGNAVPPAMTRDIIVALQASV